MLSVLKHSFVQSYKHLLKNSDVNVVECDVGDNVAATLGQAGNQRSILAHGRDVDEANV